jgi:hypothetical protein
MNGLQEDYRELLNGQVVALHANRAARFAAQVAAGAVVGYVAPPAAVVGNPPNGNGGPSGSSGSAGNGGPNGS